MLGYESQAVNDQLVNVAPGQAYAPTVFGNAWTGPGFWPRNGVFNVPPVVPSPSLGADTATASMAYGSSGGAMPSTESNSGGALSAFHPKHSPLLWAIGMLAAGLLMLQYIHYK